MKKNIGKFLSSILIVTLLLTACNGLLVSAEKPAYYEFPFGDYANWYTGVDGSTDGFTYGHLDSPTKFLDYSYNNGVASVFMTGKTLELKAYQYGSQYGWPSLYYTYDNPVELDLNGVSLEYNFACQAGCNVTLVLQNKETGTTKIQLSQLIDFSNMLSIPHEDRTVYSGSVDLLEGIKKNYISSLGDIGLLAGNVVFLKSVEIQFVNQSAAGLWATNDFNVLRLVKDSSAAAENDSSKVNNTSSASSVSSNKSSSSYESSSSQTSVDSDSSEEANATNNAGGLSGGLIAVIICVFVIAGATTTVIVVKRKNKK